MNSPNPPDGLPDDYRFDYGTWKSRLPAFRQCRGGDGFPTGGPADLVFLEHWRELAREQVDLGPHVLTDVFVFAKGEPPRRDVTKIGGLPYRPAGIAWPTSPEGTPMTFVAQYRFAESVDLVGELPGDMLLVFLDSDGEADSLRNEYAHFEWYPLGIENLVPEKDVYQPYWGFVNCYGLRHRTADYFRDVPVEVLWELLPDWAICRPSCEFGARWQAGAFSRLSGMKIGGLPVHPREHWESGPDGDTPRAPVSPRFLCSLSSVVPNFNIPYPWVNRREPLTSSEALSSANSFYTILADYLFNVWIDDNNVLSWEREQA